MKVKDLQYEILADQIKHNDEGCIEINLIFSVKLSKSVS